MRMAMAAVALMAFLPGGIYPAWGQSLEPGRVSEFFQGKTYQVQGEGSKEVLDWMEKERADYVKKEAPEAEEASIKLKRLRQRSEAEHKASEEAMKAAQKGKVATPSGMGQAGPHAVPEVKQRPRQKAAALKAKRRIRQIDLGQGVAELVEQGDGSVMLQER